MARNKGIRTVINLRCRRDGTQWYVAETTASKILGIAHYGFGMSARRKLTQPEAAALIAPLRAAPGPMLIHFKSGADRTGLASALFMADAGGDEGSAEHQLSILYGHISIPHTAAWPMNQSWEALEGWFRHAS